jgi:WD40 repeat protein
VNGVAFGPRGDVLAAADGNGQVFVWDVPSGGLAGAFADPGSRGVNGVAFAPGGDMLAAADGNGCTFLWQVHPRVT